MSYDDNYGEHSPLINGGHEEAKNSWISTSAVIVCAMAGVGTLGIPSALNASGWSGLIVLVLCCIFSVYTGIILGRIMDEMPTSSKEYSDIGEYAFGKVGRFLALFSVYVTLVGVSIVFLILTGLLMNGIFPKIPHGFWTLVIGLAVMTPISISLKTFNEVKFITWFGFAATALVVVISVVLSVIFYKSDEYAFQKQKYGFEDSFFNGKTYATAFSVFTFAFGATAIFPSIYVKMIKRVDWPKAVIAGYGGAMAMYVPIAITGYLVYGSFLATQSTILGAILSFDPKTALVSQICSGVMVLHILSAYPVTTNPVFLAVESKLNFVRPGQKETGGQIVKRLLVRFVVSAALIVSALFFPYFLDVMSLISCISVSLSGFILPVAFYLKICKTTVLEKIFLIIIFFFGIAGSIVGLVVAVMGMVADVQKNPNPFEGLFHFG